jgi:hypothetical protein
MNNPSYRRRSRWHLCSEPIPTSLHQARQFHPAEISLWRQTMSRTKFAFVFILLVAFAAGLADRHANGQTASQRKPRIAVLDSTE